MYNSNVKSFYETDKGIFHGELFSLILSAWPGEPVIGSCYFQEIFRTLALLV